MSCSTRLRRAADSEDRVKTSTVLRADSLDVGAVLCSESDADSSDDEDSALESEVLPATIEVVSGCWIIAENAGDILADDGEDPAEVIVVVEMVKVDDMKLRRRRSVGIYRGPPSIGSIISSDCKPARIPAKGIGNVHHDLLGHSSGRSSCPSHSQVELLCQGKHG